MFKPILKEMFHPSKAAIIESLKRSDGLPVSEVAKEVDMSYMGVKQHCINLEKAGFVTSWRVPRKEVGRPEKLYRLTDKCDELFPVAGLDLTKELLEGVKSIFGDTAPEKLFLSYFESKKEAWAKKLSKESSVTNKATKLVEIRETEGYFSKISFSSEDGLEIVEFHNPLEPLFASYPTLKRLEDQLFTDLLGVEVNRSIVEHDKGQKLTHFEVSTLGKVA